MGNGIFAEAIEGATCPICGAPLPSGEALEEIVCPQCQAAIIRPGKLGQYRLIKLLGKGGMGAVYEGVDDGLQRKIAVKIILKEKADAEFIEQFKNEAQAAAKLNSPHIVSVYAFGDSDGQPYLVMELVLPDSLDRQMKTGPLYPAKVLLIGEQIAEGLKAAAEQGLVHGDVKPENILINQEHQAKLADFGIAALAGAGAANNEVWGTPYYIAPETLRKQKVDLRADIYSLGGTLYHAIAGVPPFEGKDAVEVMKGRLLGPAKPLQEIIPNCPEGIAKIIMRMLEADPIRRYPNYDSLINDMKREMPSAGSAKRLILKPTNAKAGGGTPTPAVASVRLKPVMQQSMPKAGLSKKAVIALLLSLVIGVPLLIFGVVLAIVFSVHSKDTPETHATTPAVTVAVDTRAADREALAALSQKVSALLPDAEAHTRKATAILKQLARQAERAVSSEQQAWLVANDTPAPTVLLQQLQKAYQLLGQIQLQTVRIQQCLQKIDQLTIAAQGDQPTDVLITQGNEAFQALQQDPIMKPRLPEIEALQKQWKKYVDQARNEMEAAIFAQQAAEKRAAEELQKKAQAEALQLAIKNEVESIAQFEAAVGSQLDLFEPDEAINKFTARTKHLKSKEAKVAAKCALERMQCLQHFKAWLVESGNNKSLTIYAITATTPETITLHGRTIPWKDFVLDQQQAFVRLINGRIINDAGARDIAASERAKLALDAYVFLNRYCSPEMFAKSKTLRDIISKLEALAKALPGTRAMLERIQVTPEESEKEATEA